MVYQIGLLKTITLNKHDLKLYSNFLHNSFSHTISLSQLCSNSLLLVGTQCENMSSSFGALECQETSSSLAFKEKVK